MKHVRMFRLFFGSRKEVVKMHKRLDSVDKLHQAGRLLQGIRDMFVIIENSVISDVPDSICVVMESTLERAMSIIEEVRTELVISDER